MKRFLNILLFTLALSTVGCSSSKVIPDGELADIFHDIMLVNAYQHQHQTDLDSVQIYTPVVEGYGYSLEDLNYTIGNFSKRKSARLSDVVERAVAKLEEENKSHKKEIEILDSIDAIAIRRAQRVVYADTLVELYKKADSSSMIIRLANLHEGRYTFRFDYFIDSLDKNNLSYRSLAWVERDNIRSQGRNAESGKAQKLRTVSAYLTKRRVSTMERSINITLGDDTLVIQLIEWRGDLRFNPHVTIKNLEVEYSPTKEDAVDALYHHFMNIGIFSPSLYEEYTRTESSAKQTPTAEPTDSLLVSTPQGDDTAQSDSRD